jgi:hypothetical protein
MDKFWVVMKDSNTMQSSYRHFKYEEALEEAHRLAQEKNDSFFVFECKGVMKRTLLPVIWEDSVVDTDDE